MKTFVDVGPDTLEIRTPNGTRFEDGLFVRSQVFDGSVVRTGPDSRYEYSLIVHLLTGKRHTFLMQSELAAETAAQQVRGAVLKRPVGEAVTDETKSEA